MNQNFFKQTLGAKRTAESVARRVQNYVPAYKSFLISQGIKIPTKFDILPTIDKKNYIQAYPLAELLGNDSEQMLAIFRSSGSSGNPFFWPYLRSSSRFSAIGTRIFLEQSFAIHKRKTLAIVGLGLGSWLPGEHISWGLKNLALQVTYPFLVFTPGNNLQEVIEMIQKMRDFVEQIIVFIVPSAISHLHQLANHLNISLPLSQLRYVVLGEPFPESIRTSLAESSGLMENFPFMLSMYGSTDTGGMGTESPTTFILRKLLVQNQALAKHLGISLPIPLFFHFFAANTFLEIVDGNLCITRWQGIPLVRYIVFDKVAFYNWRKLKKTIINSQYLQPKDEPLVQKIASASNWLPNLLAVTGRSDRCLIIGGTNLTEYILDEAVKCEKLKNILTGIYRARMIYEEERQYIEFDLELRQEVVELEEIREWVYSSLIEALGRIEPFFLSDWQNIYRHWDSEPNQRILRLNFLPWPSLSQTTETSIKQRGIC
jgi:phenylacetate-CoA ligase